jgi:hypothetical protein
MTAGTRGIRRALPEMQRGPSDVRARRHRQALPTFLKKEQPTQCEAHGLRQSIFELKRSVQPFLVGGSNLVFGLHVQVRQTPACNAPQSRTRRSRLHTVHSRESWREPLMNGCATVCCHAEAIRDGQPANLGGALIDVKSRSHLCQRALSAFRTPLRMRSEYEMNSYKWANSFLTPDLTPLPMDSGGFGGIRRNENPRFSSAKRKGGIQWTPPSRTLNLRVVGSIAAGSVFAYLIEPLVV